MTTRIFLKWSYISIFSFVCFISCGKTSQENSQSQQNTQEVQKVQGSQNSNTANTNHKEQDSSQNKSSNSIIEQDDIEYQNETVDPKNMLSPLESLKQLDKKVESYHLGKNLTPDQIEANKKLKRDILRGTFDIRELCRLSLSKHWDEIGKEEQNNFVKLMIRLLEKKAIFSKEQLKGNDKYYKINYKKEVFNQEKDRASVTSTMKIPKDKMDLTLTYKFNKTPYGWKIYDVVVDDASLLTNYKFQFHKIITTKGFDELKNRMESKLKKIK